MFLCFASKFACFDLPPINTEKASKIILAYPWILAITEFPPFPHSLDRASYISPLRTQGEIKGEVCSLNRRGGEEKEKFPELLRTNKSIFSYPFSNQDYFKSVSDIPGIFLEKLTKVEYLYYVSNTTWEGKPV